MRKLTIIAIAMLLSLAAPSGTPHARASGLRSHEPILIFGNAAFTTDNGVVSGSGTSSDPYIIEGWDIDTSTANGIRIFNTDAYFVMRNVLTRPFGWTGLILLGVTNGLIENSTFSGVEIGDYSRNIVVSETNFVGGAVSVEISYNITLTDDTFAHSRLNLFSYDLAIYHSKFIDSHLLNLRDVGDVPFPVNATIKGNDLWNSTVDLVSCGCFIRLAENNFRTGGLFFSDESICEDYCTFYKASSFLSMTVYHNNFFTGLTQASQFSIDSVSWDNGYPSGGNFWGDYSAGDNCAGPSQDLCPSPDGIGDIPANVPESLAGPPTPLAQDRYPLVRPFAPPLSGSVSFLPTNVASTSRNKYLTALAELPKGISGSDLVLSSVRLNGTVALPQTSPVIVFGETQDRASFLILRFSMADVKALLKSGMNSLEITGNIVTRTHFRPFIASDTVNLM